MAECERKQNRTIYEQQITTDNPDAYANLRLTIEGISETGGSGIKKKIFGIMARSRKDRTKRNQSA